MKEGPIRLLLIILPICYSNIVSENRFQFLHESFRPPNRDSLRNFEQHL